MYVVFNLVFLLPSTNWFECLIFFHCSCICLSRSCICLTDSHLEFDFVVFFCSLAFLFSSISFLICSSYLSVLRLFFLLQARKQALYSITPSINKSADSSNFFFLSSSLSLSSLEKIFTISMHSCGVHSCKIIGCHDMLLMVLCLTWKNRDTHLHLPIRNMGPGSYTLSNFVHRPENPLHNHRYI